MIYIGVTGWGDHYSLYPPDLKAADKLPEYSGHFPVVEVDSSFYAIQSEQTGQRWVRQTPKEFGFIIKAFQGMTGHQREIEPFKSRTDMFQAFKDSLRPFQAGNKLVAVLFQFPPWFDCQKKNVDYIRYCKQMMGEIPVALEFRHQSWFNGEYRLRTLEFMKEEGWIHTVVDEPQAGDGSVPIVPVATHSNCTLIRLHGRNVHGWNKPSSPDTNWRDVRYLYRYNKQELLEWKDRINSLVKDSRNVFVLFNNNSGGDAAQNAKELQALLGIEYEGLAPRQLGLF